MPLCVHPGSGKKGKWTWSLRAPRHQHPPALRCFLEATSPTSQRMPELASQAAWSYALHFIDVAIHKSIGVGPLGVRPREVEGVN